MRIIVLALMMVMPLMLAGCDSATGTAAKAGDEMGQKGPTVAYEVVKSDEEWREILTPEQYAVLRNKGTEAPYTGQYTDTTTPGVYKCAACGAELFSSQHKFQSDCGWPAFYLSLAKDRVRIQTDETYGMIRSEVVCARCGSHLGHVFDDAPDQPTGQRYCINSVSLIFVPAGNPAEQAAARGKP